MQQIFYLNIKPSVMKPSSFFGAVMATVVVLISTSFTSGKETTGFPQQSANASYVPMYYFYLAEDGSYQGFFSTNQEIANLEELYDVYVDTSPFGGTLLSSGYAIPGVPHTVWASVNLYGHF
jgi:hypothetical protein